MNFVTTVGSVISCESNQVAAVSSLSFWLHVLRRDSRYSSTLRNDDHTRRSQSDGSPGCIATYTPQEISEPTATAALKENEAAGASRRRRSVDCDQVRVYFVFVFYDRSIAAAAATGNG